MLDLHSHTTASDGVFSPVELVEEAYRNGVRALAVTDHDTIASIPEARAVAGRLGMELIPGVELSATQPDGRSIHVLGYFFDETDPKLTATLSRLVEGRDARNLQIAAKLTALGMPVTIEEVTAKAKGSVGRPHFAQVMIERGYVQSFEEAFDRWLAEGRPACIERFVITPKDAIDVLHGAGGIAVLAHPLTYGRAPEQADALLARAAQEGMDGVEVYYASHSPGETNMLGYFARRHGLLFSGGGDFHVPPWPSELKIPLEVLEPLRARAQARRSVPS